MAGPSPNPELDDDTRVVEIIAILSVTSILSTLVVVLRCYSRAVILRSFGLDDAIMVPAQILTLASAVAIGLETKYGLGRHRAVISDEDVVSYMKSFFASIVVYNIAVCLTKISILLQYNRIFSNTMLRKVIMAGLIFLSCWGVTLCFLLPMVCMPVAKFWRPEMDGFCLDSGTIWYVMAGVNVVTDFSLFTMPIPVISSLQLPKKQKGFLMIVFTLGIFPCAVSIYRITTLSAAARSTDITWDNVNAATFSFLELTVGVITICLPTLRPVLVHAMPRIFGSLLRSAGRTDPTGPTGGRASRTPFGGGAGGAAGGGSVLASIRGTARGGAAALSSSGGGAGKGSTLRGSESTEGLRLSDEETVLPRSRLDDDVEFGELDKKLHGPGYSSGSRNKRYSVSVVGGWGAGTTPPASAGRPGTRDVVELGGIKTTTVVTQQGDGERVRRRNPSWRLISDMVCGLIFVRFVFGFCVDHSNQIILNFSCKHLQFLIRQH
ncbi:hypothetical protein VTH06DRAFT_6817 [Thermothelomyces fergusii]